MKELYDNGIINSSDVEESDEMTEQKKREEYIKKNGYKLWSSTDGKWYIHVPDSSKSRGTRIIKRNSEEEVLDAVVDYYREKEVDPTI